MASQKGWVKIHRCLQDNVSLWDNGTPFDTRSAWIDLILSATHEEKVLNIGGEKMVIHPGEYFTSVKKLAERWKWSRGKVDRFLERTSNEHQTDIKRTPFGIRISLVNWALYQCEENEADTKRTRNGHETSTKQEERKKNKEKYKKKSEIIHSSYDFDALEDFIDKESLNEL